MHRARQLFVPEHAVHDCASDANRLPEVLQNKLRMEVAAGFVSAQDLTSPPRPSCARGHNQPLQSGVPLR